MEIWIVNLFGYLLLLALLLKLKDDGVRLLTGIGGILCLVAITALLGEYTTLYVSAGLFVPHIMLLLSFLVVMAVWLPAAGQPRWPQRVAQWLLWTVIAGSLVVFPFINPALSIFWYIFFIITVTFILEYGRESKQIMLMEILGIVHTAIRQNLPLPQALAAAVDPVQTKRDIILTRIAGWLGQGCSLSQALEYGYPRCPGAILGQLRAAERSGQTPAALEAMLADFNAFNRPQPDDKPSPMYLGTVFTIVIVFVTAHMTFIMPRIVCIMEDMGGMLPGYCRVAISVFNPVTLTVIFSLLGAIVLWQAFLRVIYRRPGQVSVLHWSLDYLKWMTPVWRRLEQLQAQAEVIRTLRQALAAGRPVDQAVMDALELDINCKYRARLLNWLERIRQGQPVHLAAARSGVGRCLAWVFNPEIQSPDILRALRSVESIIRAHRIYLLRAVFHILNPVCILLLGALVGWVVLTVFRPLVDMIVFTIQTMYS